MMKILHLKQDFRSSQKLLRRARMVLMCLLLLVWVTPSLYAQAVTVSGKVVGSDDPGGLPGVNILEKGTTNGVVTDTNGSYKINVPDGATLVFSSVGYVSSEVAVKNQTTIDVTLTFDVAQLQEVVVVGYGEVKKSDLTGSVASVSGDRLVSKGTVSAMESMQGTMAGVDIQQTSVRPGGGFSINIRGLNSLNTSIKPLFVVDGIVTDDIDFLNPSDIKKVDILKDASSTAIYGSRGSSGVVLITTKKADNARAGKLNVNYDGYYGVRETVRTPDFMDGREFLDYRASAYWNFNQTTGKWFFPNNDPGVLIMSHTDGVTGAPVWANRLYEQDYTDFSKLAQRKNGAQQNHYVNLSGSGTGGLTYNVGMGYQNEKGNFAKEDLNRYNIKLSVDHKASDFFQVGATANFTQTNFTVGAGSVYQDINRMPDFFTPYHPDGSVVVQPGASPNQQTNRNMTGTMSPLAELNSETNETRRLDLLATMYMQITPMKGLDIRTTISPRYARKRVGAFVDLITDTYLNVPVGTIRTATSDNTESMQYTWDNMINYKADIGTEHHLSATGVFSLYSTRDENLKVQTNNLPYSSGWYNMFSGTLVQGNSSSSYSESSLVSGLGRVNYDYRGKYLLTASLRYDGASRLADKWAAFPSAAIAWKLKEESFLTQANWLSDLKLRLSYGQSGSNAGVSPFATVAGPNTGSSIYYNFGGTVATGFAPGSPVNSSLTWEKTREFNLGIDFAFFKSRVYGTINLYDKLSNDLLLTRNLAIESGVASMKDNIGSVSNRGIEVELNTVNIERGNFSWTTNFTFSSNKNEIVSIYNKTDNDIGNTWFIGSPVRVIYDYNYLGNFSQADYDAGRTVYGSYKGNPGEAHVEDRDGNGILNADDKMVLGNPNPKWIGGVTSTMRYKNIDFSFNIFTRQGMLIEDQFSTTYLAYGGRSVRKIQYDYYTPAGVLTPDWDNFKLDENGYAYDLTYKLTTEEHMGKYPMDYNTGGSFYSGGKLGYYKDASFVKVKNITVGYTFNKGLIEKMKISSLRVYANVLNPFVFTKYWGYDPEYATTAVNQGNGPATQTYQFGVNLKF
jgi:TonB-linked SusC/RagA family outer membrane protein